MGEKKAKDISSESTRQIHYPNSCILLGRLSTKVVERNMKFHLLFLFCHFFPFSLTWDHMGGFQTTSPMKEHSRFAPPNSCVFGGGGGGR